MRGEQLKLLSQGKGLTLELLPEADRPRATVPNVSPNTERGTTVLTVHQASM
ncbi:hypothetical protein DPMN_005572 [Dreissena polymorpha]|uniref:Uncharacterized protein n=1 Tax=Dreissena polymorpha TaxID=45954 RepID=A0A9D4MSF9_DREPO|nr:hypothetical protein DPMN_005572 [Dreissena polymorpha]